MNEDSELFLDMVDEKVLDDFAEQTSGYEIREDVELPNTISKYELKSLVGALITAFNAAMNEGELAQAVTIHRLIKTFIAIDDEIHQQYHESQEAPANLLEELFER